MHITEGEMFIETDYCHLVHHKLAVLLASASS